MSHQLARRWFTVGEYNRMAETGILSEDDRVDLNVLPLIDLRVDDIIGQRP